ncbi:hypothetical protein GR204_34870 [Rhizobium leguminosarum]|uniref:Uncharacterized protein n=1 Tax=Rhizobium leguminosarum TaxID=384 RepID=A0A6P0BJK5_RHILE|nr:hypothetical protein [Rhizobium leguminosarum]NEI39054.1 hypothetical protein [Rhizobium leguminosarum]NEI45851.1 hypothetical protein [Rhizobium leguminosarum]
MSVALSDFGIHFSHLRDIGILDADQELPKAISWESDLPEKEKATPWTEGVACSAAG